MRAKRLLEISVERESMGNRGRQSNRKLLFSRGRSGSEGSLLEWAKRKREEEKEEEEVYNLKGEDKKSRKEGSEGKSEKSNSGKEKRRI